MIYGLSLSHEWNHFAGSLIEGITYRIFSVYGMLRQGRNMEIVMSGGILGSPVWLQNLSDFLGRKLLIPTVHEASAYGAFIVAPKALGEIENHGLIERYLPYRYEIITPDHAAHEAYREVSERYVALYEKIYGE